jgi:hypothetical protein
MIQRHARAYLSQTASPPLWSNETGEEAEIMMEMATAQRKRVFLQGWINTTTLAGLNQADVCESCFALTWLMSQQRAIRGKKIPYHIPLPGIFSSIDSHVKQVVHTSLDQGGVLPHWFPDLGHRVTTYVPGRLLHWSRFKMVDAETQIQVTGSPDDVFILDDGHIIIDYKCARETDVARTLFPRYQAQLAVEALVGSTIGLLKPKGAALIYLEPLSGVGGQGASPLSLQFTPVLRIAELDPELPHRLLGRAASIRNAVNSGALPTATPECSDCLLQGRLLGLLTELGAGT